MTWKNAPLVDAAPAWASAPEVDVGSTSKPAVAPVTKAKDPGMFKYLPKFLQDMPMMQLANAATPALGNQLAGAGGGLGAGVGGVALNIQDYLGAGLQKLGAEKLGGMLSRDALKGKSKLAYELMPYQIEAPIATGTGKLAGEIAATLPVGGLLGKGAEALFGGTKYAAPIVEGLKTGGLSVDKLKGGAGLLTRAATGAATGGVSAGLIDAQQAKTGALVSGALPVVAKAAGELGTFIGKAFKPSEKSAPLVKEAIARGMPLGVADIAEGNFAKATRSILNDLPLIGGPGAALKEAQQAWLNREVGKTFGVNADRLTPEVIQGAKDNFDNAYTQIWKNNILKVDDATLKSFNEVKKSASMLPAGERARVGGMLKDLQQQVQKGEGGAFIPGEVAQRYRTKITEMESLSSGFLKKDLSNLKKAIDASFKNSVSAADAQLLKQTDKQYKAYKTVSEILNKGELGVAGREAGDIPAALLPEAVRKSYPSNSGKTELGRLSALGSKFMVDRVARTGGSTRALIQNSAIGTGLTAGIYTNPVAGLAAIPTAYGLNKLLNSPSLANRAANFSAPQISPEILRALQRTAPVIAAQ